MRMLLVLFGFLIAFGAHAQRSLPLKGPQAKNYHPLKAERGSKVVARAMPLATKGPQAKNSYHRPIKPGEATIRLTTSQRMRLKGPDAKNYRPRVKKSFANVFRNRSSEE
jgi:hypothetical protein